MLSPLWSRLSEQVELAGGNGRTTNSWKITQCCASAACVDPRSPSLSTVKHESSSSSRSGPSGADSGNAPGSVAQTAADAVASCTRRMAPSSAGSAPVTTTAAGTVTGLAQASIGSGGVPACLTAPLRARGLLLRSRLLGCFVLQSGISSGEPSEASDDQSYIR